MGVVDRETCCRQSAWGAAAWRDSNAQWSAKNLGNSMLKYEDIKYILQRRLQQRQGTVSEGEIHECVEEFIREKNMVEQLTPEAIAFEEGQLKAYLAKRVVPTFGHVPKTRPDRIHRLLCANINSISTTKVKNYKAEQIKAIKQEYNISGILMCEHGLRMSKLKPSETLQHILDLENSTSRAIWTHNKHNKFETRAQQGGCAIIMLDEICQ
jgi:hypothetical protein